MGIIYMDNVVYFQSIPKICMAMYVSSNIFLHILSSVTLYVIKILHIKHSVNKQKAQYIITDPSSSLSVD